MKVLQSAVEFLKNVFESKLQSYDKYHVLSYQTDGFYLDGIKIKNKKAKLQFAFLKLIIEHSFYEVMHGKSHITSIKLHSELNREFGDIDLEQIYFIARNIRHTVKKKMKADIEIISSESWNGYRLCDGIFLMRN